MDYFNKIMDGLMTCEAVEGIMLGGSRATGMADANSDYDVYVYLNQDFEESVRRSVLDPYVSYMEYGNDFWELEDDGTMKDGIDLELIYRRLEDIDAMLKGIVLEHGAWNGYTTCFWDNVKNSKIMFDRNGTLAALKSKYHLSYPKELKENIIVKNFKLMKDKMPSFYYQIEKAVKHQDLISINHRTTELLAGYFDIVFAVNESLHPGEKRLKEACMKLEKLPEAFESDIDLLFTLMYTDSNGFLCHLDGMIKKLHALILCEGYSVSYASYEKSKG